MTGPAAGNPDRGVRATVRPTGTRDAAGGILIVLALGLVLRVIIAYLLPGSGFKVDLDAFRFWASNLASAGLGGFYARPFFHDYTPGYLYVLWLVGQAGAVLGGVGDLIKVPPILADLGLAWLAWSMVLELGASVRAARIAALVVVLNPITWFDSVVWGQVDSVGLVFLLLGLRELWRDRPERSAVLTVVAAIIKPQLGILIPLVAVVTIRRALRPVGGYGAEAPPARRATTTGWEWRVRGPLRILTTGAVGVLTAVALSWPFGLSIPGLVDQIFKTASGYPYLSVNAYNPWALVTVGGTGIAQNSGWVPDVGGTASSVPPFAIGLIPGVVIGSALLALAFVVVATLVARRPDRLTMLVGLTVLALAFFVLPTRVHERYLFPLVALGAILAAISVRWRFAYVASSVATFANMYVVLTTLYPDNPGVRDWLGAGPAIRSWAGVAVIAISQLVVLVWAATELRRGALDRLAREVSDWRRTTPDPEIAAPMAGSPAAPSRPLPPPSPVEAPATAPMRPSAVAAIEARSLSRATGGEVARPGPDGREMPRWEVRERPTDVGLGAWFRARLNDRPIRPDRSRALQGETGGRIDHLDLWVAAVLLVGLMTMRVWRLAEPYQMHFDEVYHARTGTEFLQDWRYGIPHDIYEWTHPHFAKYAIAAGIVAWGDDRVTASSELGVPVTAAVIEPRWDASSTSANRTGDRLYVATGSEVRAYDLATRALVAVFPVPGASALAIDATNHRLIIGTRTGELDVVDTTALDRARAKAESGAAAGASAAALGTAGGPVRQLYVTSDGREVVAALDANRVVTLDATGASVIGTATIAGVAQIADGGSGPVVQADPAAVSNVAAEASSLAGLLGLDRATLEAKLRSVGGSGSPITLGPVPTGSARTSLDAAIAAGSLAGVSVQTVPRVAIAGTGGVAFLDPGSGQVVATVTVGGPAAGVALTTGLDADRLYVTTTTSDGPSVATITVSGDTAKNGPVLAQTFRLPGPGAWVGYDRASQMVHVLGARPAGSSGQTVYVIEPHGNAVYADAALPFTPVALALDAQERYPTTDREQLFALAPTGATATIDVGHHAFAWRLPGVFAGAVMAVLLYLLTRLLFRRRSIALLVALFSAVDGMLFVQSRIGMNDTYVGVFIVAAYLLFAALWTGVWRSWRAFWLVMPVMGLLLGLALASKWVAAYAIGALGVLVLARSALGRLVLIAGMIVATTLLGYMAISVPGGGPGGNYLFMAIMIGLTLVAVVATVVHPIAWSWEEYRFTVVAPAAAGGVVFLAALALGRAGSSIAVGSHAVSPIMVAFALVALAGAAQAGFLVAGRFGFGPLARPPRPDDPAAILEPPAPAPEGWLRIGTWIGLPVAWTLVCLIAIPVVVYVVSYIPWALIENHQLWPGWPPGHTGQTLLELTGQMYQYHNTLSAAHPASSPWWAWIFDLKPVWFYQGSFADGTSAAIYDAGNIVLWWLGIPAMAFVTWQAFVRRSPALALLAIGFACQWVAWARIDRAAFQYHYYTSLPFVVVGVAYFLAELWHGASRRTWLLARLSGAAMVLAPTTLWLFHRPLCGFVGVDSVNPGSQACPTVIPEFDLTGRSLAIVLVVGVGLLVIVRQIVALGRDPAGADGREAAVGSGGAHGPTAGLRPILLTAVGVTAALIVARSAFADTPIVQLQNVAVEPIALVLTIPLLGLAAFVATARDAHRFVAGMLAAIAGWFVLWYPNIAALPLPSTMFNAYQGFLPTYVYPFQFPVSTVNRNLAGPPLFSPVSGVLLVAITITCIVVAYSAWIWRIALAERDLERAEGGPGERLAPG